MATDWSPEGGIIPWQTEGTQLSKPLVAAVHRKVLTPGIELMLAADIVVAAKPTSFAQLEILRGIYPFGGATIRFPRAAGWGNAMRRVLTAEPSDTTEAHRIGIVQEVVADNAHLQRAVEIAHVIARQAPLGVHATLTSARLAVRDRDAVAEAELAPHSAEVACQRRRCSRRASLLHPHRSRIHRPLSMSI